MRQLNLFGVPGDPQGRPDADPVLAATRGMLASRRYRIPVDLAMWVTQEAGARGWSPDTVVAYAVAKLQQDSVWAMTDDERREGVRSNALRV